MAGNITGNNFPKSFHYGHHIGLNVFKSFKIKSFEGEFLFWQHEMSHRVGPGEYLLQNFVLFSTVIPSAV
jgi:hypothetical protein